MRLIMMSTGAFAAPTLKALLASAHEVALLVTRPPAERGRRKPPPNPSAEVARAAGLEVWAPDSVNDRAASEILGRRAADLLVVCDYGEILKPRVLAQARRGGINLHASLLPKYRGAAPIAWAIYHGEAETGDTVFQLTPGMDAGPILAQCSTPIGPEETSVELKERLAAMGAALVLQTVDNLAAGREASTAQDATQATRAPRLKKDDGVVDWNRAAWQIKNQVRGLKPWPATYTFWRRSDHEPIRLILDEVQVALGDFRAAPPGEIVDAEQRLVVAAGEGFLELLRVQVAGKRAMPAADFLRGHAISTGDALGPE
jgi:methionyl-tRNA formyltransferase